MPLHETLYIPLSAPRGRGAGGEGEPRAPATAALGRDALTLALSQRERGFFDNRKTLVRRRVF